MTRPNDIIEMARAAKSFHAATACSALAVEITLNTEVPRV